uniref:CSON004115 protein n=1 Tax=Culicoides sonorensis TaxID=179676 RepID=A0A336LWR4_CULSO
MPDQKILAIHADGNFEVTLATKATIYSQGLVEWKPPAIYKSSCEIDVEYFPFDEQTCVLKFGSWTYDGGDGHYEVTLMTKATVFNTGLVIWQPPAVYKSSCSIDVEFFPYDVQTCVLKLGSWTYDGFKVDLRHMDEKSGSNIVDVGVDLSEFYMSVEWDILEVPAVSDSGEKVTLSISILISLHVFFLLVVEIIPPTSLVVPLLGKYLIFAMILVSISICVTVVVLNVHFRSPQTHKMAPWVKRFFIDFLPKLLFMKRPNYNFETNRKLLKSHTCFYPYYSAPNISRIPAFGSRTASKEDLSPSSFLATGPFGGSCQIHGPIPMPQSESEDLSTTPIDAETGDHPSGIKSPIIHNPPKPPAFSHSYCPPEIHRSCFCVRFIAEHTKMQEDSTKVKEDWKYVAMVLDRLFLWIFTFAVVAGTAAIILQAPTLYDDRTPIDKRFTDFSTSSVARCPPQ